MRIITYRKPYTRESIALSMKQVNALRDASVWPEGFTDMVDTGNGQPTYTDAEIQEFVACTKPR